MPPTSPQPGVCEIRSWLAFQPGYWRKALYGVEDCRRIAANFDRTRAFLGEPVVKLGHDREQRLQDRLRESLGFLSLGQVSRVLAGPDGRVFISLSGVPTAVGAEINAGRIRSGSVELIPFAADPADPSRRIDGPIMVAVALLGEEMPAVKGLGRIPRAVFADGREVPASGDPAAWLQAMTDVARMSARAFGEHATPRTWRAFDGSEYPLETICFSEMTPMGLTPELLQSLGLTPEQIEQIMAAAKGGGDAPPPPPPGGGGDMPPIPAAGGDGGPPAPPPPPGGGDMPPPIGGPPKKPGDMSQDDQTMMSAAVKKCMSEMLAPLVQRVGAMEAKHSDATKSAQMSAAADRVDLVLKANAKRIPPNKRAAFKQLGIQSLVQKNFADVEGDAERAFAAWREVVELLPESANFSEHVADGRSNGGGHSPTPFLRKLAGPGSFLDTHAQTAKRLDAAAK